MADDPLHGKLSEQWRLMKEAPIPYGAGILVLAALMFGAFQWGYGRIIDQKDTQIATLKGQLDAVSGDRDSLKGQLASRSPAASTPERDPDALYQLGRLVAHTYGAEIDLGSRLVRFSKIIGTADYASGSDSEFRDLHLQMCQYKSAVQMGFGGVVKEQAFSAPTCPILGSRP